MKILKKAFCLFVSMLFLNSCLVDHAYYCELKFINESSHDISISSVFLYTKDYKIKINAGSNISCGQECDGESPTFKFSRADVCFDDNTAISYSELDEPSQYNICIEENWTYETDGFHHIWTYTFTDDDFEYAKMLTSNQ